MGTTTIGGESVQQTLLAREFVRSGYDVSMIVVDHGQPDGEVIDGIKVFKSYRPNAGLPVFRFVYPRASSIFKALQRADADIYYQSCASPLTGFVAWHCKKHRKKFVFRIASDTDCMPGQQIIRYWRDRKIYEYGLRRADLTFAQSQKQIELLEQNYGLKSGLMNMVVDNPTAELDATRDIDVLWVSNIRPQKRPEMIIDLAAKLPELRFVMIGGPSPGLKEHFNDVKAKADSAGNVEFLGAVPYSDVSRYFSRTKIFVNTSDTEGFPNTFLQSWIHGVPVVSFFDPDGIIRRNGLGFAPESLDEMAQMVVDLISREAKRQEISLLAQEYAIEHYSPRSNVNEYIRVFSQSFS